METSRPNPDQVARWEGQAAAFAKANWPSNKIRAVLIERGCPNALARKIASAAAKKQGLRLIGLGLLALAGWVALGLLRSSGQPIPSIAIIAALLGGLGLVFYGLFQVVLD